MGLAARPAQSPAQAPARPVSAPATLPGLEATPPEADDNRQTRLPRSGPQSSIGCAPRRLAADQPRLIRLARLVQHQRFRVHIERRLVAPRFYQHNAVMI